jgi:peptide/nickel transport system permease protein
MARDVSLADSSIDGNLVRSRPRWLFWRKLFRYRLAPPALFFLVLVSLIAVLAPAVSPHPPNYVDIQARLAGPSSDHLLGTDENGRDVVARLIYGARASLGVGFISMAISILMGTMVGGISGFFGRWLESVLMRITDGLLAIPTFFLVLVVVAVFGTKFINIVMVIGLTSWMVVARVVRGDVLKYKRYDFVLAAESIGASQQRILWRHVVPHAVPSLIVAATLGVANAILVESALSYLGLGISPPNASWGNMLSNAQAYIWDQPLLALYPGLLILVTVLSFNFIGDALRDALDPQSR